MSKRARVKGRATRRMSARNRKASTGFRERGPESEALIRSCEVSRIAKLVDRSGLVEATEALLRPRPQDGGRKRLVPIRSLLIVLVLTPLHERHMQYSAIVNTGTRLMSGRDQYDLGLMKRDCSPVLTYDHVRKTFEALDRRLHPRNQDIDVETEGEEACQQRLFDYLNRFVALSLPENVPWSGAQSIDSTSVKAWAIGKKDKSKRADKDAAWGYETYRGQVSPKTVNVVKGKNGKSKNTMVKDGKTLFYGYDAHFACATRSVKGSIADQPEVITALSVRPASTDAAIAANSMLSHLANLPGGLGDVLDDRLYSYSVPENWQDLIHEHGGKQVLDLHPNDQGAKDHEGVQMIAGRAHCPCTPGDLATIIRPGPLEARDRSKNATVIFDAKIKTREQYEATVNTKKQDGSMRVGCPALAGKVACPHRPETMGVASHLPIVNTKGVDLDSITMCNQSTVTIPRKARGKLIQDESWGSKRWEASYGRRTAVERKNSFVKDGAKGYIQRGNWKVRGLVKNALMLALAVVAHNINNARAWAVNYDRENLDPTLLLRDPEYKATLSDEDAKGIDESRAPPRAA